jgi:hypothetical protein
VRQHGRGACLLGRVPGGRAGQHRRASATAALLCQALLGQIEHIGLHGRRDNASALACYSGIRLQPITPYCADLLVAPPRAAEVLTGAHRPPAGSLTGVCRPTYRAAARTRPTVGAQDRLTSRRNPSGRAATLVAGSPPPEARTQTICAPRCRIIAFCGAEPTRFGSSRFRPQPAAPTAAVVQSATAARHPHVDRGGRGAARGAPQPARPPMELGLVPPAGRPARERTFAPTRRGALRARGRYARQRGRGRATRSAGSGRGRQA